MISNLLLLITALIWGIAFVAQSVGMDHVGPWTFVFFRYLVSAAVMIPVSLFTEHRRKRAETQTADGQNNVRSKRIYLAGGLCCGVFLCSATICQQAGMVYTTAGKAGFITALYVVLVPVLGLLFHRRPESKVWFCVILGIAGLYLISVKEGFHIESGDILVMLCALLFSCQILSVDHFSSRVPNVVILSNLQFFVVAIISFFGMLLFEKPSPEGILAAAVPILYAGVLSGAAGYTLQMIAQRKTDPAIASLLMSLESVFSALAGWAILGETLSARELIGCALVMGAVILAQVPLHRGNVWPRDPGSE